MMPRPNMEFFFEFASTYSYLTVMRLPELSKAAGVQVTWRPFLLGPIFKAQGWDTSPFNLYAAKGTYMWRDMERRAQRQGLGLHRPDPFPQNSLLAARVAQLALAQRGGIQFCQNVYLAQFDAGQDISDPAVIAACLHTAGLPPELLEEAGADDNKHALRLTTEEAAKRGIFGAPSFLIGDELFWGDDQLETALDWVQQI